VVERASHSQWFALGLGHGASRALVEGIATAGRWAAACDGLDRAVIAQLKQAMQPALIDTSVVWEVEAASAADGGGGGGSRETCLSAAIDTCAVNKNSAAAAPSGGSGNILLAYESSTVVAARDDANSAAGSVPPPTYLLRGAI
jgi:hypothetical protein